MEKIDSILASLDLETKYRQWEKEDKLAKVVKPIKPINQPETSEKEIKYKKRRLSSKQQKISE